MSSKPVFKIGHLPITDHLVLGMTKAKLAKEVEKLEHWSLGTQFKLSQEIWPDHPCCVVVAKEEICQKYPEAIQELVASWVKSGQLIHEKPESAVKVGVAFLGQSEEVLANMADWDLKIPTAGVKFYRIGEPIPSEVKAFETDRVSLTSCQANRQAGLGDAVFLTRRNIGCIAAAITLGLVDRNRRLAMEGPRVYTEIMRNQSGKSDFAPPTPADFSDGMVYAYNTGERVEGSMGPVRVVNSDLIVRPYLTQKINFSSYCVGARLIAQYEADRLGLGIPWKAFEVVVQGMKDSRYGYPFPDYPGARA